MTASDHALHSTDAAGVWSTIVGAGLRHWLVVALLTLCGLLLADTPFFPKVRDRVYLWLQSSDRPQKSVVVVAIDDKQFFGPLAMSSPLDRDYVRQLLTIVSDTGPAVIALDISLPSSEKTLMDAPKRIVATTKLLQEIDRIAADKCPIVLPKTIAGSAGAYVPVHDVFDGFAFTSRDVVTGFTSAAEDIRRIPIRVMVEKKWLDSFAYAVFRAAEDDDEGDLGQYREEWPYSFFFSKSLFTPRRLHKETEELTASRLLAAKPQERQKWLHAKVVLIGGDWHQKLGQTEANTIVDAHTTPRGVVPGVTTHANYVQSLLWGAMRPMWGPYRIGIELLLGFFISFVLLRSHRWQRLWYVVAMIAIVVLMTWYFSRALGVFFEMVVPIMFLGIHVMVEEIGGVVHLSVPASFVAHPSRLNGVIAAVVAVMAIAVAAHEHRQSEVRLNVNDRLEVVESTPEPPVDRTPVPPSSSIEQQRTASRSLPAGPQVVNAGDRLRSSSPITKFDRGVRLDGPPRIIDRSAALNRTSPAHAAGDRQAAADRAQRALAERHAVTLEQQLANEHSSRMAEAAELERLGQQIDENRRAAQAQLEADRQARVVAERQLEEAYGKYTTAITTAAPSDVDAMRRQIEDQQLALHTIQERQRANAEAMQAEIARLRNDLTAAQQTGNLSAEVLAQRQADILARQQQLDTLRQSLEAEATARAQSDKQEQGAIAAALARRQQADAEAAALRQQAKNAAQQAQAATAAAQQAQAAAQSAQTQLEETRRQLAERDAETRRLAIQNELARIASTRSEQRGLIVTLNGGILFDTGKTALKPGAKSTLSKIAKQLQTDPSLKIAVEGHTDNVGSTATNQSLSEKRANAVRDYLVSAGISADHITAYAKGEESPVATNKTAAGRQQNRRVDLVITQ